MKKQPSTLFRAAWTLAFVCAAFSSTGCLYAGDPGDIAADPDAIGSLEGLEVELIRHSTGCDSADPKGIVVEVGPGIEYTAAAVRELESDCTLSAQPGLEVHIDENSITFDFSNVEEPGQFGNVEFDGYIVNIVGTEDAPLLAAAAVDRKQTTIDMADVDLGFDFEGVTVNLADREFHTSSFLRINLLLARGS